MLSLGGEAKGGARPLAVYLLVRMVIGLALVLAAPFASRMDLHWPLLSLEVLLEVGLTSFVLWLVAVLASGKYGERAGFLWTQVLLDASLGLRAQDLRRRRGDRRRRLRDARRDEQGPENERPHAQQGTHAVESCPTTAVASSVRRQLRRSASPLSPSGAGNRTTARRSGAALRAAHFAAR